MAKSWNRLIHGALALLLCALAPGNAHAQTNPWGSPGRPPEVRSLGNAKPGPAQGTEPRRGRYAAPIELEKPPALEREAGRPNGPSPLALPRPPATSPSPVTACDPGGCWDSGGQRYNGSGAVMIRGDGKVCQHIGATMQCN